MVIYEDENWVIHKMKSEEKGIILKASSTDYELKYSSDDYILIYDSQRFKLRKILCPYIEIMPSWRPPDKAWKRTKQIPDSLRHIVGIIKDEIEARRLDRRR